MEIRPIDRLILAMLADITKSLKIEDGIDADFVLSAIHEDQLWALTWEYPGLIPESETPAAVRETCAILDLWRRLDRAIAELPEADRDHIKSLASPFAVEFQGFDGNHDPHYRVLRFLTLKMDRYEERNPPLNSHTSTSLPHYRAMLEIAKKYPVSAAFDEPDFSKDQIVEIIRGGK